MEVRKAQLFLSGVFRLEDKDGERVDLKSAKAQGLLAMLAMSRDGERNRAWLQSNLWSDRAPEQASGSLRQALMYLRRILDPLGVSLEADRTRVALSLDGLTVINDPSQEFLEGIDVRDDAFESWLRTQRSGRHAVDVVGSVVPKSGWAISLLPQSQGQGLDRWFECLFSDSLSRSLREVFAAPVQIEVPPTPGDHAISIRVESFAAAEGSLTLRVTVEHPALRHQVWSGHCTIPVRGAPPIDHPDLLRLVVDMIEALGDYFVGFGGGGNLEDPDSMCRLAIRSLFSMDPARIIEADNVFAQAYDMNPRGLYLAWRAQLKAIQSVEKLGGDPKALAEEGVFYCEQALELEPNNSMVLATLSNALRRFSGDKARSLSLAKRSAQLNPANPMAWSALSSASAYVKDEGTAYRAAVAAHQLVKLSPHRFWFDCQRFIAALPLGELDQAIAYAERTHMENPKFKPPLRYLVALYANDNRTQEALLAAERLKTLEDDFSIERLLRDMEYPASLIRQTPKLNSEKLSLLL